MHPNERTLMKTLSNNHPRKVSNRPEHEKIYLCDRTPSGLFKDSDGNKYLTVDHYIQERDCTLGVAIALAHSDLRPFTWQVLGQQPLGYGSWHGSYRIRLVDALEQECSMGCPGVVSVGDRHASIRCPDLTGTCHMISLGYVGKKGFMFRDFDGWIIETSERGDIFFRTSTKSSTGLVLRPRASKRGTATINNILKELVKKGLFEKELKSPNSSKFGYRAKLPAS